MYRRESHAVGRPSGPSAADALARRTGRHLVGKLLELVGAARATLRTIHRSLAISLVYNTAAASLAMAGLIGPLVAAILMPVSSFTVLALAFFAPTFGAAE